MDSKSVRNTAGRRPLSRRIGSTPRDQRVRKDSDDLSQWWTVFNDPTLDALICDAYRQNLSLRQAGFQVLLARAQLGSAIGGIFPQTQVMTGDYLREGLSVATVNRTAAGTAKRFFGQWDYGFNLAWELDFWGRFRRTIESADDNLDASVENYDDVLVTLLGDVASNYVTIRTLEERIKLAKANVDLQRRTLEIAEARFRGGTGTELDVDQAQSNLSQTESEIPQLEVQLRMASNQLCILLGIPPEDLQKRLAAAGIPAAPPDVAVGIPADLLRRRPDVRRAERLAAAQCALIGVAESDFYPHISIDGSFGYSAEHLNNLFTSRAFNGTFGPAFNWKILNYGRLLEQRPGAGCSISVTGHGLSKQRADGGSGSRKWPRIFLESARASESSLRERAGGSEGGEYCARPISQWRRGFQPCRSTSAESGSAAGPARSGDGRYRARTHPSLQSTRRRLADPLQRLQFRTAGRDGPACDFFTGARGARTQAATTTEISEADSHAVELGRHIDPVGRRHGEGRRFRLPLVVAAMAHQSIDVPALPR